MESIMNDEAELYLLAVKIGSGGRARLEFGQVKMCPFLQKQGTIPRRIPAKEGGRVFVVWGAEAVLCEENSCWFWPKCASSMTTQLHEATLPEHFSWQPFRCCARVRAEQCTGAVCGSRKKSHGPFPCILAVEQLQPTLFLLENPYQYCLA